MKAIIFNELHQKRMIEMIVVVHHLHKDRAPITRCHDPYAAQEHVFLRCLRTDRGAQPYILSEQQIVFVLAKYLSLKL